MKNKIRILLSAIWIIIFLVLGVTFLAAGKGGEKSESENRTLALAPKFTLENILQGKISDDTENFLMDHIIFRQSNISLFNGIKNLLSLATHKEYLAAQKGGKDALTTSEMSEEEIKKMAEEALKKKQEKEIKSKEEAVNRLRSQYKKTTKTIEEFDDFLGLKINGWYNSQYSKDQILAFSSVLNRTAALLPDDGMLIFTMSPASYEANVFADDPANGEIISEPEELVDAATNSNVRVVNTVDVLRPFMQNNEYMFFRTDMHWTPLGTYKVYSEMVKRAGFTPARWEDYTIEVEENFQGTLYRDDPGAYAGIYDTLDIVYPKFGVSFRRIDGVDSYHEIPLIDYEAAWNDRYTVYLGGPAGPWTYAVCDNKIERKALVICDSYGLAFVPQLLANYGEVHYLDPRYYDGSIVGYSVKEMIEKYGISDVYVVIGDVHAYNNSLILEELSYELGD